MAGAGFFFTFSKQNYFMRSIFLLMCFVWLGVSAGAQQVSKVLMKEDGTLTSIGVELDENVVVLLSPTGEVGEFGIDIYKGRTSRLDERLEPYTGRVDRYTDMDNEAFRGKIRSIGRRQLTYYASFDEAELVGKLKQIGNAAVEYYGRYDEESLRGKIKRIGNYEIQYYSSFDASFGGKVKAIGPVQITYYSNFEDKGFRGKVKSIGSSRFEYFSSFDRKELAGNMKRGWRVQYVSGIKFLLR